MATKTDAARLLGKSNVLGTPDGCVLSICPETLFSLRHSVILITIPSITLAGLQSEHAGLLSMAPTPDRYEVQTDCSSGHYLIQKTAYLPQEGTHFGAERSRLPQAWQGIPLPLLAYFLKAWNRFHLLHCGTDYMVGNGLIVRYTGNKRLSVRFPPDKEVLGSNHKNGYPYLLYRPV